MLHRTEQSIVARSSRGNATKPPPQRVLGWRETRLYEMIQELWTRRGLHLALQGLAFVIGTVFLIVLAVLARVRE